MLLAQRLVRSRTAIVVMVVMCASVLTAISTAQSQPADAAGSAPATVTTDPLPTVQINGVVWDQVIVAETVYAVGSFSTARPAGARPGQHTVRRANVLAYSLRSGRLVTGFAPVVNGPVKSVAVSPGGTILYLGGSFSRVDGVTRHRIAAVQVGTGRLVRSFGPSADAEVRSIVAKGDYVYLGGAFSRIGSAARSHLARVTSGGRLSSFAPRVTGGSVQAVAVSARAHRLMIGGSFTKVNGSSSSGFGLAMFDTRSGRKLHLAANTQVRAAGPAGAVTSLTAADSGFYGTAYRYEDTKHQVNLEGPFRIGYSGKLSWVADCHGDSYDIAVAGRVAYVSSHEYYCGNLGTGGMPRTLQRHHYYGTAFTTAATGRNRADMFGYPSHRGQPSPSLLNFYPEFHTGRYTSEGQATWTVSANDRYVVYGGEFTAVNGTAQQGLVRFAARSLAPRKQGPSMSAWLSTPTARSSWRGAVRVIWPANLDRDGTQLTYRLYRKSASRTLLVTTRRQVAQLWQRHTMAAVDSGLAPGAEVKYWIVATDADGNAQATGTTTVRVARSGSISSYDRRVLADGATTFWPLHGSTHDLSGGDDPLVSGAVRSARNHRSMVFSASRRSAQLTSVRPRSSPDQFSLELWFRSQDRSGGTLAGYTHDRRLVLTNGGRICYLVRRGTTAKICSGPGKANDGWHHVVGTLGGDGMMLFVDSRRVRTIASITGANPYLGRWQIGGAGYVGQITDVAAYGTQLSLSTVRAHRRAF